jgi:hypothetical protein
MNDREELQRFAEGLMRLVRDEAIRNSDALAAGKIGAAIGEHWKSVLADSGSRAAMRALIPDVVDEVLFQLLHALDSGDLPLAWQRQDGSYADLYDLGRSEMAGWLMGTDGWRETYSQEPIVDHGD